MPKKDETKELLGESGKKIVSELVEESKTETSKDSKKEEIETNNIFLIVRSSSYKNEVQINAALDDLLGQRNPTNAKIILIKKDKKIIPWLEEHNFRYEVYKKESGEETLSRNIRAVKACRALIAFIKRNSTGDSKWRFVQLMLRAKKQLYLVIDENGEYHDKKWKQ